MKIVDPGNKFSQNKSRSKKMSDGGSDRSNNGVKATVDKDIKNIESVTKKTSRQNKIQNDLDAIFEENEFEWCENNTTFSEPVKVNRTRATAQKNISRKATQKPAQKVVQDSKQKPEQKIAQRKSKASNRASQKENIDIPLTKKEVEDCSNKPKKKKKKRLFAVWQIIGIIFAFGLLCYPMYAEIMSSTEAQSAISDYSYNIEKKASEEIDYLFANARAWNDVLSNTPNNYTEPILKYEEQIEKGGIAFAWMEMPSLGSSLPIYHGVEESALQVGVGHYSISSLPVGGANTHSILMGHSGMPGSRMFDDIENLDEGDKILIHVLNDIFAYEVKSKTVVWPDEVYNLKIEQGKDQITLVTCTPYGVNDHRLLVNAQRVDYVNTTPTVIKAPPDPEGIVSVMFNRRTYPIWIGLGILFVFVLIMTILKVISRKKKRKEELDAMLLIEEEDDEDEVDNNKIRQRKSPKRT